MSNRFPTDFTDKWSADSTDKILSSDGVTNFNITVDEVWTEVFTDRSTTNLSEWTNLYYTDARVDTRNAAQWVPISTTTNVATNSWVLDEDNMVSDDATKVPTQQSVKAYVDNNWIPINGLPAETSTVDADEFVFYDASAAVNKKITRTNLLDGFGAIEPGTTNTYLEANTERTSASTTPVKVKEFTTNRSWGFTVSFDYKADTGTQNTEAQVYINWTAAWTQKISSSTTYATFSENFFVNYWDLVQLYHNSPAWDNSVVRNFNMKYDLIDSVTAWSVDLD